MSLQVQVILLPELGTCDLPSLQVQVILFSELGTCDLPSLQVQVILLPELGTCDLMSLQVQVIPWMLGDSNFVRQPSQRLDSNKTVFVGALHGMMTAEALANIMNDLFANVVYAGIDTDKHKYPIGMSQLDVKRSFDGMLALIVVTFVGHLNLFHFF
jgi:hypothetical protein